MLYKTPVLFKRIYPSLIWNLHSADKIIYLTFDDGPIPEVTPWVLKTLKQFNAKATFFCIGDNVSKHPDIFESIINENHSIGNHTFNHLHGWKTTTKTYLENVEKCASLVKSNLFRPPYGKITRSQIKGLKNKYRIIMWEILSYDFERKLDKLKALKQLKQLTREGSIVVFHDSLKAKDNLNYLLPEFLEHFSKQGYEFKGLPEEF